MWLYVTNELDWLTDIPIRMLIVCRQQMRWHTVIIITDKLEIFIFCRQHPAGLTFQLFSWDCPVYDQYSSCPAEDWALCSESFISSYFLYYSIIITFPEVWCLFLWYRFWCISIFLYCCMRSDSHYRPDCGSFVHIHLYIYHSRLISRTQVSGLRKVCVPV